MWRGQNRACPLFGRGSIVVHQPELTGPIRSGPDAYLGQSNRLHPLLSRICYRLLLPFALMLQYCIWVRPKCSPAWLALTQELVFVSYERQAHSKSVACYERRKGIERTACLCLRHLKKTEQCEQPVAERQATCLHATRGEGGGGSLWDREGGWVSTHSL